MSLPLRMAPGRRPAHPVTVPASGPRPDDWLCCWSYRSPAGEKPYWELKFIHAACPDHNRLEYL